MLGLYAAVLFVSVGSYFYIVQLRKNADQGRGAQLLLAQLEGQVQREHALELADTSDATTAAESEGLSAARAAIAADLRDLKASIGAAASHQVADAVAGYERNLDEERGLLAAGQQGLALQLQQQADAQAFSAVERVIAASADAVAAATQSSTQRADFGVLLALVIAMATVSVAFGSYWRARRQADETAMRDLAAQLTMERALQEQLSHQALTDALTELPNRALFMNRVEHALTSALRYRRSVAILFIDMDHFKDVNDTLGHLAGDQLLVAVARRLRECVRAQDTVARLGGDEFALLLEDVSGEAGASRVAKELVERFREPFVIDQHELFVTTSVGVAVAAAGGVSTKDVLRQADVALYRAKAEGRSCAVIFEPAMDDENRNRLTLEGGLRHALERGELVLSYQPLVNLKTGSITGLEALVRWRHPQRGLIAPSEFIFIAEEIGLIVPIGEWILREACSQLAQWRRRYPALDLMMSVNVSVR
ncbi:MAG TPA: diguanylate cyclase, partial [Dehalococcoidia bacterium]|nr:diguanylate cyclase [Dehalococcoidia bacterium]